MATIKPFVITVSQTKLDDLRERLKNTIWPSTITGQSQAASLAWRLPLQLFWIAALWWVARTSSPLPM